MKNFNFKGKVLTLNNHKPLYHIGTMDISNKSLLSTEGNGLSVSSSLKDWVTLLSNEDSHLWSLYKEDIHLLDYSSLTNSDFEISNKWGVSENYLEASTLFKLTKPKHNEDCNIESIHTSFRDALLKSSSKEEYTSYEDYLDFKEYETFTIEKILKYSPTAKLQKTSMVNVDDNNCEKINLLLFLEINTFLDGVYWSKVANNSSSELIDSGTLFNSRVNTFDIKKSYLCENCNSQEAYCATKTKNICKDCESKIYGKDILNPKTNYYTCSKCGKDYFFGFGKCSCYTLL